MQTSVTLTLFRPKDLVCPLLIAVLLLISAARVHASERAADAFDAVLGNYRISENHVLGLNRFIMDDGQAVILYADYLSGVVRRLFPKSEHEFIVGPGFNTPSPTEINVDIVNDASGTVTGIKIQNADGSSSFADRMPLKQQDVIFRSGDVKLAGTLIEPDDHTTHPAIVLLHGSGPLTRYSFGPYPYFFTSLGFAVLIYDKRGTGQSTGTRMDASTADLMKDAFYPEYLSDDALAAMEFLRHRERIDSKYVGAWGSSEGGMLATQIATRSNDVAFAINSSGFMGPLWQTFRYQAELILRKSKNSAAAVQEELALIDMWFDVGRTGKGWEKFEALRDNVVNRDGSWFYQSMATSYEQTRWFWTHTLSFDPLPALKHVRCPVLAVFGELDPFTDAANASENMRRVLSEAGHRDFTIKVFPNAGHSLSVMPSKDRMAPGVFDTLRSWLLARVRSERHH